MKPPIGSMNMFQLPVISGIVWALVLIADSALSQDSPKPGVPASESESKTPAVNAGVCRE
jgi:hypothetical protein